MSDKTAYVYMLQCSDGSLYTGWTFKPSTRLREHREGRASKYTRSRRPVRLRYLEKLSDKRAAMKREAAIKKLSRSQKLLLLKGE